MDDQMGFPNFHTLNQYLDGMHELDITCIIRKQIKV